MFHFSAGPTTLIRSTCSHCLPLECRRTMFYRSSLWLSVLSSFGLLSPVPFRRMKKVCSSRWRRIDWCEAGEQTQCFRVNSFRLNGSSSNSISPRLPLTSKSNLRRADAVEVLRSLRLLQKAGSRLCPSSAPHHGQPRFHGRGSSCTGSSMLGAHGRCTNSILFRNLHLCTIALSFLGSVKRRTFSTTYFRSLQNSACTGSQIILAFM